MTFAGGLSITAVIAVAAGGGGGLLLLMILTIIFCCCCRRKRSSALALAPPVMANARVVESYPFVGAAQINPEVVMEIVDISDAGWSGSRVGFWTAEGDRPVSAYDRVFFNGSSHAMYPT